MVSFGNIEAGKKGKTQFLITDIKSIYNCIKLKYQNFEVSIKLYQENVDNKGKTILLLKDKKSSKEKNQWKLVKNTKNEVMRSNPVTQNNKSIINPNEYKGKNNKKWTQPKLILTNKH